jgi:hypothetical protein
MNERPLALLVIKWHAKQDHRTYQSQGIKKIDCNDSSKRAGLTICPSHARRENNKSFKQKNAFASTGMKHDRQEKMRLLSQSLKTVMLAMVALHAAFALAGNPREELSEFGFDNGGPYGYVNQKGEVVIAPIFEIAGRFAENGLAVVKWRNTFGHDKYGFINEKGEWAIPAKFEYLEPFSSNGLALAGANPYVIKTEGMGGFLGSRWIDLGFINRQGEWVIKPRFTAARSFAPNGLAVVTEKDTRKQGAINAKGEWVFSDKSIEPSSFSANGLAPAKFITQSREEAKGVGYWGYVDATGRWAIERQFGSAYPFAANGLALASEPQLIRQYYSSQSLEKYGFINAKGEWVIAPTFELGDVRGFAENGLAAVKVNQKWGFINAKGEWVIPPKFYYASSFYANGWALASLTGMSGMINIKGEWVVPPLFEPRGSLSIMESRDAEPRGLGFAPNGLAWVIEKGRERIINSKGEFMPAFDAYIDKHRAELEIKRKELAQQLSQRKHVMFDDTEALTYLFFLGALYFLWLLLSVFGPVLLAIVLAGWGVTTVFKRSRTAFWLLLPVFLVVGFGALRACGLVRS